MRKILAGIVLFAGLFLACGYTVSSRIGTGKSESVLLTVFENHTEPYQPGIEVFLYRAIADELRLSSYALTQNVNLADITLNGEILEYKQTVLSTDTNQTPTEIQVAVKIKLIISESSGAKNTYILTPKPEPFAVVKGETLEQAGQRALKNAAKLVIFKLGGESLQ